jgi:cytochrome c biogenesis protein CcmG, thiol:disulfide interchange protein DsbE
MRRAAWIAAALALVVVLVIGLTQAGQDEPSPAPSAAGAFDLDGALQSLEGAPAPLEALHGQANQISDADADAYAAQLAKLKGYPVVVNAWASWCGPCKLEFPVFQRVSTKLGKQVGFVGLNVSDNRQDAEAYLKKTPVPYPHLEDKDSRIVQKAGARGGLPTTIYYDKNGERAFVHQGGYTEDADLEEDIRKYAIAGA